MTNRASAEYSPSITRALLISGLVAMPIWTLVTFVLVAANPSFNFYRDTVSLLELGSFGWVQDANFALGGILTLSFAIGIRRLLRVGKAATLGPILFFIAGLGFLGAGVFHPDPINGFPAGLPTPATSSYNGIFHILCFLVIFISLSLATFSFAHRDYSSKRSGWVAYSLATGVLFFIVFPVVSQSGYFPGPAIPAQLVMGLLYFLWYTLLAWRLLHEIELRAN